MQFKAKTLDDLLHMVLAKLIVSKQTVITTRGATKELTSVLLRLTNPRARLSRTETKGKVFSGLGELLWYLSKSNKLRFIQYYLPQYAENSDDGRTLWGAYGPRLFNMRGLDQVRSVTNLLRDKPGSRRAVIQLLNAEDVDVHHSDIPCTSSLQFLVRSRRLHMIANMRSNDAYLGLPHDVFCFTMVQELVARTIGVDVGNYDHFVGSLHLYDRHEKKARNYLDEGWQATESVAMPRMPIGDPQASLAILLKAESALRLGKALPARVHTLDPYWADLLRLLQIYRCYKDNSRRAITTLRRQMQSPIYDAFIQRRKDMLTPQASESQMMLSFTDSNDHEENAPQ